MRKFVRFFIVLATLAALAGLAGCSDSMIANRDDQRTPSVPPAPWENNPMNLPTQGSGDHIY